MTLLEIETDIYSRLGKSLTPDTVTQARIRRFINQRYRRLRSLMGNGQVADFQTTLDSVASQQRYAFGPAVSRINTVYETTNQIPLTERSLEWLRNVDPNAINEDGTPEVFVPVGYQPVATQPADASELFVKSTSASDTGTCYVEVVRTGQMPRTLSVTMTGLTAVSLGAAITDAEQVTKFFVSAAAVGRITLHEDSGAGTELGAIPIGQVAGKYFIVLLWPTPASVITYNVDFTTQIPDLAQANDTPLVPEEFHYVIAAGARMDEYEKGDDEARRALAERDWETGWRKARAYVQFPPSQRWIPQGASIGFSNLGGWYPADVWLP
ncbi:MAG: hypothetical protein GEV06_19785 [Luteitalea sp.]|nr:hypothetical protein [Luteitalea sp.]